MQPQVKRLLRADNEALAVNWEVITETELNANKVTFLTNFFLIFKVSTKQLELVWPEKISDLFAGPNQGYIFYQKSFSPLSKRTSLQNYENL